MNGQTQEWRCARFEELDRLIAQEHASRPRPPLHNWRRKYSRRTPMPDARKLIAEGVPASFFEPQLPRRAPRAESAPGMPAKRK
jgi:hypothetical protein